MVSAQKMSNLRILHLSTYDKGGAANAAIRIHLDLLSAPDIDSFILFLYGDRSIPSSDHILPKKAFLERIRFSLRYRLDSFFKRKTKKGFLFTHPKTLYDIFDFVEIEDFDIVHLHWVSDFINWPEFFVNIRKPVVWTLHDQNPFMGGYHYEWYRNNEVNSEKARLEQAYISIKEAALEPVTNLYITAPSTWLLKASAESRTLGHFQHTLIPYGVDVSAFKEVAKGSGRKKYGLPMEGKVVLFVADDLNEPRKNCRSFLEAMKDIGEGIVACTIGKGELHPALNHVHIGAIHDTATLVECYGMADVLLFTSLADNLPNVLLEAMACGLPVIAFNVGGLPDLIEDGKHGYLLDVGDEHGMRKRVLELCSNESLCARMGRDAQERVHRNFSSTRQLEHYSLLYKDVFRSGVDDNSA